MAEFAESFEGEQTSGETENFVREQAPAQEVLKRLDEIQARELRDRLNEKAQACEVPVSVEEILHTVSVSPLDDFDREIGATTNAPEFFASADLLSGGPEAFQALEEQIRKSEHSIDINIFSFAADSTGQKIAEEIINRAKKQPPVKVTIRIDAVGAYFVGQKPSLQEIQGLGKEILFRMGLAMGLSEMMLLYEDPTRFFQLPRETQEELEKILSSTRIVQQISQKNPVLARLARTPNVSLIIEPHLFNSADHAKVFIFDGRTTMIGGMNIGDEYSGGFDGSTWGKEHPTYWKDYMVITRNDPTALVLKQTFFGERSVSPQAVTDLARHYHDEVEIDPQALSRVRVLHNEGGREEEKQVTDAIHLLIQRATQTIDIEHAYIQDPEITAMLIAKADQGVKIRIIRSEPEDIPLEALNEKFFLKLIGHPNIRIVYSPWTLHAKLLRVDSQYSLIGSANLNSLSLKYHEEIALLVLGDSPLQESLASEFERSFQESEKRQGKKHISSEEVREVVESYKILFAIKGIAGKLLALAGQSNDLGNSTAEIQLQFITEANEFLQSLLSSIKELQKGKIRLGGVWAAKFRGRLRDTSTSVTTQIREATKGLKGIALNIGLFVSEKLGIDIGYVKIYREAEKTAHLCEQVSEQISLVTEEDLRTPTNNLFLNALL